VTQNLLSQSLQKLASGKYASTRAARRRGRLAISEALNRPAPRRQPRALRIAQDGYQVWFQNGRRRPGAKTARRSASAWRELTVEPATEPWTTQQRTSNQNEIQ
jgi:hypothetical protein